MDSLDKIINDMESMHRNNYMNIQEMPELWAMHQYLTGQNVLLQHYLTRLKALRDTLPHPTHPSDTNRPIRSDSAEHNRT
jgi:hypothetical protein